MNTYRYDIKVNSSTIANHRATTKIETSIYSMPLPSCLSRFSSNDRLTSFWLPPLVVVLLPKLSLSPANGQQRTMLKKILIFNLFVCLVSGECFFEKHFGYLLSGVGPKANVVLSVRGPLKCETLCLSDYSDQCEAANIIFIKADIYSCEIFRELQPTFNSSQLMSRLKGKFIRRKGELTVCPLILILSL